LTVVSDSSPLITLARIDCFALLPKLYGRVHVSPEVYREVVTDGARLPGAVEVAQADWIEVRAVENTAVLDEAIGKTRLGAGETSVVVLAKELSAKLIDLRAAYRQLIQHKTRIDLQTLQHSLRKFELPSL
jgi:predicted nucleic acid-binding protein